MENEKDTSAAWVRGETVSDEWIDSEIKKRSKSDRFCGNAGMEVLKAGRGFCISRMPIDERHMNPLKTVHGGAIYALADATSGFAATTYGKPGPTISGDMYFIRAASGAKEIICESRVIKHGAHVNVVEASIKDETGREVARALMQYMPLNKGDASSDPFSLEAFEKN